MTPHLTTVTFGWEYRNDTHRYRFENPGQDIVFIAKGLSLAPSMRLTVARGGVAMGFSADYVHTWPYRSPGRFTRDWFGVGAFVGWSARR